MRIRLEGCELPGISCGAGPEYPGGHPNIGIGVQRRNKPGEPLCVVRGDAESATWTLEDDDGTFTMFRWAKLMLARRTGR